VLANCNDDVSSAAIRHWASSLGLVEAITWIHQGDPPPTYQQGTRPIDGIFVAPQLLDQASGGYLSFGAAIPSDHRAIWINLHLPQFGPRQNDAHIKLAARQLKCSDPRVVDRYNQELMTLLNIHKIPQCLSQLDTILQRPADVCRRYRMELNAIDNTVTDAKRSAKLKCRKLHCGQIQWCPRVTKAINTILFWKSIQK